MNILATTKKEYDSSLVRKKNLKSVESIVIKLGTRTLLNGISGDGKIIKSFVKQISELKKQGKKISIISSGSVGFGMKHLGLKVRPTEIYQVQALASIGQNDLMEMWRGLFKQYDINLGQILLTNDIFEDRKRFLHAKDCIKSLHEYNAIPIINENDTVSIDELQFGDNDRLSALATQLSDADLLILYTDTDGIYTANPKKDKTAKRISIINKIDENIYKTINDDKNSLSKGGMTSKIESAELCAKSGVFVVIANGETSSIKNILDGKDIGTFILGNPKKRKGKKRWILFNKRTHGKIFIDEGAENAIKNSNKSLLSSGIISVEGIFNQDNLIGIYNEKNKRIAKGVSYYSSFEIEKIKGCKTSEIKDILGHKSYDEIINRDNLLID